VVSVVLDELELELELEEELELLVDTDQGAVGAVEAVVEDVVDELLPGIPALASYQAVRTEERSIAPTRIPEQ